MYVLTADGEARPPSSRREARERARLQRLVALQLADQLADEGVAVAVRRLLAFRDLRSPTVDPADLADAVAALWGVTVADDLVPALREIVTAGWRAAFPAADAAVVLDDAFLAEYLSGVSTRIVVGDAVTPPVTSAVVEQWRTVTANGNAFGWSTSRLQDEYRWAYAWDRGLDLAESRRGRYASIIDDALPPGMNRNDYVRARNAGLVDANPRLDHAIAQRDEAARAAAVARGDGKARFLDPDGKIRTRLANDPRGGTLLTSRPSTPWQIRADRIARTESIGAYNAGTYAASVATGGSREWLATPGPRTRDSHLAASGQCQNVGSTFDVGGAQLLFPGDPAGPPEEVINCRCTLLVFDVPCEDRDLAPAERAAQDTIDDAFDDEMRRRDDADV